VPSRYAVICHRQKAAGACRNGWRRVLGAAGDSVHLYVGNVYSMFQRRVEWRSVAIAGMRAQAQRCHGDDCDEMPVHAQHAIQRALVALFQKRRSARIEEGTRAPAVARVLPPSPVSAGVMSAYMSCSSFEFRPRDAFYTATFIATRRVVVMRRGRCGTSSATPPCFVELFRAAREATSRVNCLAEFSQLSPRLATSALAGR